jgi:glutamate synthase (NADPH) small chain
VTPRPPVNRTWKKVAIVGSGPAGLAAADQLNRAGHSITVFEKADRIGGLLRYGIPEFKMEKRHLDRRLQVMEAEGVIFRPGVNVGVDVAMERLRADYDAVLLAGGAEKPRDLPVPGRELTGIHFAMDYLTQQNRRCEGDAIADAEFITAKDRHVVIIGGGDTGADCLGTAHRQGARAVHQLELMPMPPEHRTPDNPWPQWPQVFRVSTAHEEGGERLYAVSTQRFSGDAQGRVRKLHAVKVEMVKRDGRLSFEPVPGSEFEIPADLVLLAMGFTGPMGQVLDGVDLTARGNVRRDAKWMTNMPGVFTAGDMQRGQSLIVWAIAEGRSAARAIDEYLMGESQLPAPLQ